MVVTLFGIARCRLLLGLASLAVVGCARPTGTVQGKVQMGDQTIVSGRVTFVVGTEQQHAIIQRDGSYQAREVPVGTAKVLVSSPQPRPGNMGRMDPAAREKMSPEQRKQMEERQKQEQEALDKWVEIPRRYSDPRGTPLTLDVKAGENQFPIHIAE